ncbi:hypothetical protein [Azospirillum brasilense]|uniref:hypothetical protein n=1 Tax=Azospirillum brasilense TaxID=192 RepID=UPI000E68E2CA|nr:hypothetical protein [Azospirillum brasilense]NUB25104.1 hypothetical protein [Azospirillum brasilense]NUB30572.1 hypothetical protein [Azospirillum brasilense]RIW07798.1 hypothetical protein D2T81_02865 [Azospirillum brasilense]
MRTKNGDHTVTSSGSNVYSSGTRWPCPGPSSVVPSLGIPFRDAATRLAALVKEQDELPDTSEADARSDEITEQWEVLGRAILGSIPRTLADSVAVIDTALFPAIGPNMDRAAMTLFQRVRGVLVQAALDAVQQEARANGKSAGGSGSTMIPSIGLTFAGATSRAAALIDAQIKLKGSENPDANAERARLSAEWSDLLCTILTAEPATLADAVAVLDRLLCPHTGIGGTDIEVEALTRLRDLLARQVEQLDDGADCGLFLADVRRWLELEATIGAEGQDDADLIDSSEEAYRLALKIAAYDGNPTLAMAAKALLLWAEHPVACHPDSRPGALPFPPPVSAARKEEDALIFGLVADALRAVPELKVLLTGNVPLANESDDFGTAIASLADRAIPHTAPTVPTVITDAMVEAGANAAGCSPDAFRAGFAAALKMMEAA